MQRLTAEQYREAEKTPIIAVLDNVRSAYNVGSIFRTADAFRIEGLALCGITAVPPSTEIHKTALGAEEAVPWRYYASAVEAVKDLTSRGYHALAVEQTEGSTDISNIIPAVGDRYAVIFGNEVKGVSQEAIDLCEGCIEIPQRGTKHSMNVAVTAGIILFSLARHVEP